MNKTQITTRSRKNTNARLDFFPKIHGWENDVNIDKREKSNL